MSVLVSEYLLAKATPEVKKKRSEIAIENN